MTCYDVTESHQLRDTASPLLADVREELANATLPSNVLMMQRRVAKTFDCVMGTLVNPGGRWFKAASCKITFAAIATLNSAKRTISNPFAPTLISSPVCRSLIMKAPNRGSIALHAANQTSSRLSE
jgi:hypothetical protein